MPNTKSPYQGKLSISRWHDGQATGIRITVEDEASSTLALEAEITVEDLGKALTLSTVPCSFEINAEYVGWIAENKSETVTFKDRYTGNIDARKRAARKAVKPFEKNGWRARWEDLLNDHCRVGKPGSNQYQVMMYRHVHPKTGEAK